MTALMPVENRMARSAPSMDGGELALGLLLRGIAVAAVFVLPDDPPLPFGLHELEDFGCGIEAVVRGVDDGCGNGVMRLAMFAVAVYRQRRRSPFGQVVNFSNH